MIETIVRAADRISIEIYLSRADFKEKPAAQLYANYKTGKRYKRLGATQLLSAP